MLTTLKYLTPLTIFMDSINFVQIVDPYLTKMILFISLVRPILEYGSIIWYPCYAVHISSIEAVQKQFLIFYLRWNSYELTPYRSRLALIKMPTLKSRRSMLSTLFILGFRFRFRILLIQTSCSVD